MSQTLHLGENSHTKEKYIFDTTPRKPILDALPRTGFTVAETAGAFINSRYRTAQYDVTRRHA